MRPCRSTIAGGLRGQVLLAHLVTVLMVGMGSAGLVRWTVELLTTIRCQAEQEWALELLQDQFEFGPAAAPAQSAVIEGTAFTLTRSSMQDRLQGDAACGAHMDHTVTWTDARGRVRSLGLRTHHCERPRAY